MEKSFCIAVNFASPANCFNPRWLQGMVWPTLLLWLYACAQAVATFAQPDGVLPPGANQLSSVALSLVIAGWVRAASALALTSRGRSLTT